MGTAVASRVMPADEGSYARLALGPGVLVLSVTGWAPGTRIPAEIGELMARTGRAVAAMTPTGGDAGGRQGFAVRLLHPCGAAFDLRVPAYGLDGEGDASPGLLVPADRDVDAVGRGVAELLGVLDRLAAAIEARTVASRH